MIVDSVQSGSVAWTSKPAGRGDIAKSVSVATVASPVPVRVKCTYACRTGEPSIWMREPANDRLIVETSASPSSITTVAPSVSRAANGFDTRNPEIPAVSRMTAAVARAAERFIKLSPKSRLDGFDLTLSLCPILRPAKPQRHRSCERLPMT